MALSNSPCPGPYEIVEPLDAWGTGEVYRARDEWLATSRGRLVNRLYGEEAGEIVASLLVELVCESSDSRRESFTGRCLPGDAEGFGHKLRN
ncbi:MAG: hypothetical protein HYR60_23625 [Acidobacteria bacterium]|nr:hypothetical protein [Acidobacteriota bacterium]